MTPDGDADSLTIGSGAEEADLQASMTALSRLAIGQLGLEELLTAVASLAVKAIPNASGAGLTLAEPQRPDTVVVTDDFVRDIEDIQYEVGEGPCISAMQQGQTVLSRSLGGDTRWPRFGGRVARLGVHSETTRPIEPSSPAHAAGGRTGA